MIRRPVKNSVISVEVDLFVDSIAVAFTPVGWVSETADLASTSVDDAAVTFDCKKMWENDTHKGMNNIMQSVN